MATGFPYPDLHIIILIICLCILNAFHIHAQHTDSLQAYVPAAHKTVFSEHNLLSINSLSLSKSAVEGAIAVGGDAVLQEFKIGERLQCDTERPVVIVKQRFIARIGSIMGGPVCVGRKSRIAHTVHRKCSEKVDRYRERRAKVNFEQLRRSLIREGGELCRLPPGGKVKLSEDGETMEFYPGNNTYSCYNVFRVQAKNLRNVRKWVHKGDNYYQNFVISILGKKTHMKDFAMVGFNARRTVISFCSVYGKFDVFNSRIHASIIAPLTTVTSMDTVINGSLAADTVRGRLVMLRQPYVTC